METVLLSEDLEGIFYDKDPLDRVLHPLVEIVSIVNQDSPTYITDVRLAIELLAELKRSTPTHNVDRARYTGPGFAASFLYSLMDYAPIESARARVAQHIVGCVSDDSNIAKQKLQDLSIVFFTHLIRSCKQAPLENLMTLNLEAHSQFGELKLWFEAIPGTDNTYKIEAANQRKRRSLWAKDAVRFVDHSSKGHTLPNLLYLCLHAACAKIACMSGAGKIIDRSEREVEEHGMLAKDGSSAFILASRLVELDDSRHLYHSLHDP
ncbi:hypothetical protein FRC17_004198 [Serendipita sp. 399]|nr:hypothetical protein FRC17_004198 [Serendipita sp. 399]